MIANREQDQKMTAAEYLEWEAKQELRHEYIDGEIVAMTGGSLPHNDIALNLYRALYPHLRDRGCRVNVSDAKVQARKNSRYFYPDLVVSCDPDDLKSREFIQKPKVIVEVLSPGTANYDRTKKLKYYRQIPSLQEYVLVDSEEIVVEVYRRGEGKMWLYYEYEAGETIALESIEFECAIELLYEGVSFEQELENP
ncbi:MULTISPECIES: Uma2 family endonuclease [unclassified Microcoleus]|uniref:Uma2 family endonuclease n=1 Tax=unclassified Microcoleus TaxID=2642155 RepID=UPI002FD2F62A